MTDQLLNHLAFASPGGFSRNEVKHLIGPRRHPNLLSQCRAKLILNRVRLVAFLFAVLVPLSSVVELMLLPLPLWIGLVTLKLTTSAGLVCLLLFCRPNGKLLDAYRAGIALAVILAAFHIASQMLLVGYPLNEWAAMVTIGYGYLPVVLVAGIAVFPLSALESLAVASVTFAAQALAGYLTWTSLEWLSFVGTFWLLLLIAGVATLASSSQLAFLMVLVRQAIRDPLTGAFARGSGEEILQLQWNIARRNDTGLAVVFLVLDQFESITATFGQKVGNQLLRDCTRNMLASLRSSDSILRLDGETFAVIMPDTDMEQGRRAMERLVQRGLGLAPNGQPMTASIGLTERCFDFAENHLELLAVADKRMRHAMAAGGNRLCFGTEPDTSGCAKT